MAQVDVSELRDKVKAMYKAVAEEPHGRFHFDMGRDLAGRLGYPAGDLDRLPPEAIESFAGVGYHLGLAAITSGERVVDLGSGSGMDLFLADEGLARSLAVMGRVASRPATIRKMAWLMPRMAKAVPYLGYIVVAATKTT